MDAAPQAEFRYQPKRCAFLRQVVWAIKTPQADGSWHIVNCLDKDEGCFSLECAFTTPCGEWPFQESRVEQPRAESRPLGSAA